MDNVIIEVDHQRVSEFGRIISIRGTLHRSFTNFQVFFLKRHVNLAAHGLLRTSRRFASFQDFPSLPNCIYVQFWNDSII